MKNELQRIYDVGVLSENANKRQRIMYVNECIIKTNRYTHNWMENELNKWNTFVHEKYETIIRLVNKAHEGEFKTARNRGKY